MNVKRCAQCGILRNNTEFRKYSYQPKKTTEDPNKEARYSICRQCEAINARYVRALKKADKQNCPRDEYNDAISDIKRIEALYEKFMASGLKAPRPYLERKNIATDLPTAVTDSAMDKLEQFYTTPIVRDKPVTVVHEVRKAEVAPTMDSMPADLAEWLTADPATWVAAGLSPEYLHETIYESLKAKYRPWIGTDERTYLPIYDDTYKDVLNQILRKLDDYEDEFLLGEAYDAEEVPDATL